MSELSLSNLRAIDRNDITLKYVFNLAVQLFIVFISHSALADDGRPEPQGLINDMSVASRSLNYDGVFMYRSGTQVDTMRIIHKADKEGVSEKLISLTGHAREVVRNEKEVKCYFPEDKTVVVDESRTGKLISSYIPHPIETISDFYNFSVVGEGRIAGLDAWIVNIVPKDSFRYGYQLWVDKNSRLLLKSELKNQQGITLEQVMFAQLDVKDDIDESLLEPSYPVNDFTYFNNINAEKAARSDHIQWQATWMPAGFIMRDRASQSMVTSEEPVEHLVYTDGLAMVSVFVEKMPEKNAPEPGSVEYGGVNAYAVQLDGYQITAVGEVPKSTVRQMADSVRSQP